MTRQDAWRPISQEELSIIAAIVSAGGTQDNEALVETLGTATVSNSTPWILDVRTTSTTEGATGLPDGPFPARAYVTNSVSYQGEIIIWLTNGKVSGLEYAWTTDDPPSRWPQPYEMEIVPQENFLIGMMEDVVDSGFNFLTPGDSDLLTELLGRRNPSLLKRIRQSEAVSQVDADDIVSTIGEELVDNLDDDWEPTDYGHDVSALLDRVNAARISEWP